MHRLGVFPRHFAGCREAARAKPENRLPVTEIMIRLDPFRRAKIQRREGEKALPDDFNSSVIRLPDENMLPYDRRLG
jgi:hypothetical protein